MSRTQVVAEFLESLAPVLLAESWDNVGLLIGDADSSVERVMTCLTVTPDSVAEAISGKADLVVTHHPFPFHATKRLTTDSTVGRMLLQLIQNRIAVYSAHTAFDSARRGINQQLAESLGLQEIVPLVPVLDAPSGTGGGRVGFLPEAGMLGELADKLTGFLGISHLQVVGSLDSAVQCVAVACGAAGQFLDAAIQARADLLVLGETSFHTCLEAQANGTALFMTGHFASERFAVENLAEEIGAQFPSMTVWASKSESDPISIVGV